MKQQSKKKIGYYGDDFTGSTDAMEALTLSGVRTILFLKIPSLKMLNETFSNFEAFGIAGISRSLGHKQMEEELNTVFQVLKKSGARICHYKTCSTFDSSPEVGSIGKAIDIALETFTENQVIPVIAGVPALKRYTVFGNHFANLKGDTYRLDRHPVMSKHPVTPMHEADLRLHLSKQTRLPIELLDIVELSADNDYIQTLFNNKINHDKGIVLFDALDNQRLQKFGHLIWNNSSENPQFTAGSSGVEYALTSSWVNTGEINQSERTFPQPESAKPMLAVSGSASLVTKLQIEYAENHGFYGLKISGEDMKDNQNIIHKAKEKLSQRKNVLIYSALGPEDPDIDKINDMMKSLKKHQTETGKFIGETLGKISKEIINSTDVNRFVIAGGDTSGYVLKELDIFAMEMIAPFAPGAPLCKAYSENERFNGLELNLKGGQIGETTYFVQSQKGSF